MFKPGDKVKCILGTLFEAELQTGKIYTVIKMMKDEVLLKETDGLWLSTRFILLEIKSRNLPDWF